eukprot:5204111-Pleurochrysis_carterae.AAC.1
MTACGREPAALCTASATAHMPNASAAGIESASSDPLRASPRCLPRSAAVAAPWSRAACTAGGQLSDTSHAVVGP